MVGFCVLRLSKTLNSPPAGLTEEQIVRLFSSAGKVLNFRLVYDRETGRPKGFGFAEYPDSGMYIIQDFATSTNVLKTRLLQQYAT
jgi:hypothetical protein